MSEKYEEYIFEHKDNIMKGFNWLCENLPDIFNNNIELIDQIAYQCKFEHDQSKYDPEEYHAYDEYFYGGNRSYEVVQEFKKAWLHHIHNNPHHWQYWVLMNDNPEEGTECIDMPYNYIIEMICDWWSFSWKKGDLNEIFKWYDDKKIYIKMSKNTRSNVEHILSLIKNKLDETK